MITPDHKIPPNLPLPKGGIYIPLFDKEGRGDIFLQCFFTYAPISNLPCSLSMSAMDGMFGFDGGSADENQNENIQ